MKISKLKDLIRLVEESKIAELEISRFGTKVRISKRPHPSSDGTPPSTGGVRVELPQHQEDTQEIQDNYVVVKAPMVGTLYLSPAPDAAPYVEAGDIVKAGQVICIIEAMKVMNEIESEAEGRVVRILVENESAVEYGQELFHLEPLS
jgi:acetyl-CoA carboxylase biotin carboxyl carrier protein